MRTLGNEPARSRCGGQRCGGSKRSRAHARAHSAKTGWWASITWHRSSGSMLRITGQLKASLVYLLKFDPADKISEVTVLFVDDIGAAERFLGP